MGGGLVRSKSFDLGLCRLVAFNGELNGEACFCEEVVSDRP